MELKNDIYVLNYSNKNIVYSPLRRALFFADSSSCSIINRYKNNCINDGDKDSLVWEHIKNLESIPITVPNVNQIYKSTHVVIIPTQLCNLGCTYCYAKNAHLHNSVISKQLLQTILDFIIKQPPKKKRISFIGGGEPLIAWDLIKWSVDYLNTNKNENDILDIGVTTNATLFTDDIFQYLKEHDIHVGVSFEILPDIQNVQRPFLGGNRSSFDVVNQNIQNMIQHGIRYSIRSTITKLNVHRMSEMVEFVAKHYPNIRKLHLEQVTDKLEDAYSFYDEYISSFYKAKQLGKQYQIDVYNSISKSIYYTKYSFCNGELCITPTGSIVACHRVSEEHESAFPLFNYGKVTENGIYFFNEAEKKIIDFSRLKSDLCTNCFAKWHCGGICPMERSELPQKQILAKCEFIKKIILRELYDSLIEKLNNI